MPHFEPTPSYRGLRATVMGLGRFGGGVGAVRFLAARGARVTVTDLAGEAELAESLAAIADGPVDALHLGGHREDDFRDADLVVVNPAVRADSRFLAVARDAGVRLTTEIDLFLSHARGKIVGVTGSTGKSTTASLIHSILESAGRTSRLGGNIGVSLLPVVDDMRDDDWTVLELSSFQLEWLDRPASGPDIAVVTNFQPNHLDRHGTLAAYRAAKQMLLRHQRPDSTAVLNADDADVAMWPAPGRRLFFGAESIEDVRMEGVFGLGDECLIRLDGQEQRRPLLDGFRLPGEHMRANALAAACAALAAGIEPAAIDAGLRAFRGLPHRLEFIAERDGRRFFDDSKATTPEAACAALAAFTEPVVLIAGGWNKQVDLTAFARAIAERTTAAALVGQTAPQLADSIRAARPDATIRICETFEAAFAFAVERSQPGDVVLLSPGCASYGLFRDYEERGRRFQELARAWRRTHLE
ncbi:MAG: UDP-N-acetylmuramoyl-L-alanine--D-glutamate ligase [Planctomycetaceae bacterium]